MTSVPAKPKLLLVDDDEEIRTQMKWALSKSYEVILAQDRTSALQAFRDHLPLVVLLDLGLPPKPGEPTEGLAALEEILAVDGSAKVIIISGQSDREVALRAVGAGAYDILSKPVQMEELGIVLKRTFHVAQLERDFRAVRMRMSAGGFEGMLGTSQGMATVFTSIRKVATTDAPVLILGESGTGKEMTARAIHNQSSRQKGPFVAINCGAIPETLMESELFGHEKGSFTGAHMQRKGRIETANGGTLFLDEIGEIPLALQVKLLRFLQEQHIQRVGGRQDIPVDVRIVAATNADLKKGMAEGKFREDLYYRLAVVEIRIPALRERASDLLFLAKSFLDQYAEEGGKRGMVFSPEAQRAILAYHWPGNVRELQNRVRRAAIMAHDKRLAPADLELAAPADSAKPRTLREARDALDREYVESALRVNSGNISAAAQELGISRPTLYELIDKLGLAKDGRAKAE